MAMGRAPRKRRSIFKMPKDSTTIKPHDKEATKVIDVGASLVAIVESLSKDSPDFRQVRNAVYRKVNKKEADPELMKVFHDIVKVHGYEEAKACWNELRREQRETEAHD
jgi:hypothetical protein